MLRRESTAWGSWAIAALALAAFLRLWGITWGFPETYNADEPHIVNLALSFGGGSLRPYAFKYPSLWPYLLFFSYGLYFVLWSGFGMRRGVADFIGLYAWNPAGFYLIGRLLAAAFSLGAVWWVWKLERETGRQGAWPWAACLLAFSPMLVELAHSLKPDSLMFFFIGAAWHFGVRVYREGSRREHWACGACLGLALSSQYTALPAALLLPAAHLLGRARGQWSRLAQGLALIPLAFLAGSPYALFDFPRFWLWMGMRGSAELASMGDWDRLTVLGRVLSNLWNFAGQGSVAGLAALAGLGSLLVRERRLALVLLAPVLGYALVLANNPDGGWPRYLLGCLPGLALLAGEGLERARERLKPAWGRALLVALALGPGVARSARMDWHMTLPDTREVAREWILAHVPQGAALLVDLPHASPRLAMIREQAVELWRRTEQMGSPRYRLYRGMAERHPGGGYRIYRIQRTARDLGTYHPRQVALTQAETPVLGVAEGLSAARAAGVGYVVTTSHGTTPERAPELGRFFEELYRQAELSAVFEPEPGQREGPVLRIYRL